MLKEIFESGLVQIPWPIYVDEKFFDGSKVAKQSYCNRDCFSDSKDIGTCQHGLNYYRRQFEGTEVVIFSINIPCTVTSNKKKRIFKHQRASSTSIENWFDEIDRKINFIRKTADQIAKEKFDQFHEFVKWANEINYYSNKLIETSKSSGLQGFEAASQNLKSLYKTSVMLLDSLDTSSIYFNPESAGFGNKRDTDIYSMLHKITLVLNHSKKSRGRAKIQIKGRVKNKHKVYESFKIIPLSLLQNALKYRKSQDVEVIFNEESSRLIMHVVSYGDFIPEDEHVKLFQRGYRAKSALKSNIEGNGLGLYVARVVANVHEFELSLSSEVVPGTTYAKNTFNVFIK